MKMIRNFICGAFIVAVCWAVPVVAYSDELAGEGGDIAVGDVVSFGRYEQDNDLSDGQEPIEWTVLEQRENSAVLISRYGLDARQYHNDWDYNTWENCSLRAWLNNEFLTGAFNSEEQDHINVSQNQNPDNPTYNTPGGNDTGDRVFVLNYQEATQYLAGKPAGSLTLTEYAAAQIKNQNGEDTYYCWLRTAGNSNCQDAAVVNADGSVNLDGKCVDKYEVVRPVICIDLESVRVSGGAEELPGTMQSEAAQELSTYMHLSLSELKTYFDDLSGPWESMLIIGFSNDLVTFRSGDGSRVTGIVLRACENPYSLCGIRTDMTMDEAEETLIQQGFTYLKPAANLLEESRVYYDGDKTFVTVWKDEGGYLDVEMNYIGWGSHTDKQEVAFYMGKTLEQVMNEIDGLSVREEAGQIKLEKEDIIFWGEGSDMSDTFVDEIDIRGEDCRYSLYGMVPGDKRESFFDLLELSEGGSGELIDPLGNTFLLLYTSKNILCLYEQGGMARLETEILRDMN